MPIKSKDQILNRAITKKTIQIKTIIFIRKILSHPNLNFPLLLKILNKKNKNISLELIIYLI